MCIHADSRESPHESGRLISVDPKPRSLGCYPAWRRVKCERCESVGDPFHACVCGSGEIDTRQMSESKHTTFHDRPTDLGAFTPNSAGLGAHVREDSKPRQPRVFATNTVIDLSNTKPSSSVSCSPKGQGLSVVTSVRKAIPNPVASPPHALMGWRDKRRPTRCKIRGEATAVAM